MSAFIPNKNVATILMKTYNNFNLRYLNFEMEETQNGDHSYCVSFFMLRCVGCRMQKGIIKNESKIKIWIIEVKYPLDFVYKAKF